MVSDSGINHCVFYSVFASRGSPLTHRALGRNRTSFSSASAFELHGQFKSKPKKYSHKRLRIREPLESLNNWRKELFLGEVRILQQSGFPAIMRPGNLTGESIRGSLGMLGFSSPWFLTFVQAKALGGNVKGEKAAFVVKHGTYGTEDESGEEHKRGFLKSYDVFNASQIEGIEFPSVEIRPPVLDTREEAKRIVEEMPNPPVIKFGTATAFYRPK